MTASTKDTLIELVEIGLYSLLFIGLCFLLLFVVTPFLLAQPGGTGPGTANYVNHHDVGTIVTGVTTCVGAESKVSIEETTGDVYYCDPATSIFTRVCTCGSGAGSITVQDIDGTPNYTSITTLQFDQADGYVISNPSAGIARLDFSGGGGGCSDTGTIGRYAKFDSDGTCVDNGQIQQEADGSTISFLDRDTLNFSTSGSASSMNTKNFSTASTNTGVVTFKFIRASLNTGNFMEWRESSATGDHRVDILGSPATTTTPMGVRIWSSPNTPSLQNSYITLGPTTARDGVTNNFGFADADLNGTDIGKVLRITAYDPTGDLTSVAFQSLTSAGIVGGTGTTNRIPKFTSSSTIGNSALSDNGTAVFTNSEDLAAGFGKALQLNDSDNTNTYKQIAAPTASLVTNLTEVKPFAVQGGALQSCLHYQGQSDASGLIVTAAWNTSLCLNVSTANGLVSLDGSGNLVDAGSTSIVDPGLGLLPNADMGQVLGDGGHRWFRVFSPTFISESNDMDFETDSSSGSDIERLTIPSGADHVTAVLKHTNLQFGQTDGLGDDFPGDPYIKLEVTGTDDWSVGSNPAQIRGDSNGKTASGDMRFCQTKYNGGSPSDACLSFQEDSILNPASIFPTLVIEGANLQAISASLTASDNTLLLPTGGSGWTVGPNPAQIRGAELDGSCTGGPLRICQNDPSSCATGGDLCLVLGNDVSKGRLNLEIGGATVFSMEGSTGKINTAEWRATPIATTYGGTGTTDGSARTHTDSHTGATIYSDATNTTYDTGTLVCAALGYSSCVTTYSFAGVNQTCAFDWNPGAATSFQAVCR